MNRNCPIHGNADQPKQNLVPMVVYLGDTYQKKGPEKHPCSSKNSEKVLSAIPPNAMYYKPVANVFVDVNPPPQPKSDDDDYDERSHY